MDKEKSKKPFFKKKWVWAIAVVIVIIVAAQASGGGKQANETEKSTDTNTSNSSQDTEKKARLTLDDGWTTDQSNPYFTYVDGYVSNNSDKAVNGYIQITFSALDANGANVGDCLANANTVDAGGKWKFHAICSGKDIATVRFKELTGF